MAILEDKNNGKSEFLLPQHLIGRNESLNNTIVKLSPISNIHAIIEWNDSKWHIRDLSRNGIWLNGNKLNKNVSIPLNVGDEIQFAQQKEASWIINNLSPPTPLLHKLGCTDKVRALESYNLLPNEELPETVIRYDNLRRNWYTHGVGELSDQGVERELNHGQIVSFDRQNWQVFLPQLHLKTEALIQKNFTLSDFEIHLQSSLDEEHVSVTFKTADEQFELGTITSNYLLLLLARKRQEDSTRGIPEADQGWINTQVLCHELRCTDAYANLMIYRLRKLLDKTLPREATIDNIIERRRGALRTGIAASLIQIRKGDTVSTVVS